MNVGFNVVVDIRTGVRSVPPGGAALQPIMTSNRRPAGQTDGSDNLAATVAADRAFLAAVAELDRWHHDAACLHHSTGGIRARNSVSDCHRCFSSGLVVFFSVAAVHLAWFS